MTKSINAGPGYGVLNFPDEMSDEEIRKVIAKQKPQVEFPDLPTTGRMETPAARLPWEDEKSAPDKLSFGSAAAVKYGTLATSDPIARQQIYAKHLPGAKAITDKFGNPMIEYKGQRYYTSRPDVGFDAMDAGRVAAGVTATFPALAAAPASIPGMMAVGGLVGGGQSIAEDLATQLAGGEHQKLDLGKAATSATIGAVAGPLLSTIMPVARSIYGKFLPELFDSNGTLTMAGSRVLKKAGIDADTLTPELRQAIDQGYRQNFGSPASTAAGYQRGLGDEFNTRQTAGEITGDPGQIYREQTLRGGSRGPGAQDLMKAQVEARQGDLSAAQEALRGQVGGGRVLTPPEAGDVLAGQFRGANTAAQNQVRGAYQAASDPAQVVAAGGTPRAAVSDFQGLPQRVAQELDTGADRIVVNQATTPNAYAMMQRIQALSKGDVGDLGPKGTTQLTWNVFDRLRRELNQLQQTAATATDGTAARAVLKAFDDQFAGANPLLGQARSQAAQRFQTFTPTDQQTPLTQTMVGLLGRPQSAQEPAEVINQLFGGRFSKGEASGAIDHLLQIYPPGSAARQTMAEQSVRRLTTGPNGQELTPAQIATNIDNALGDKTGDLYQKLLTPEQLNVLKRFRALNERIAYANRQINPSGSGHVIAAEASKLAHEAAGAGMLGWLGSMFGPAGKAIGAAVGSAVGAMGGKALATSAARAAVNPSASVGAVSTRPAAFGGGLLGSQVEQAPQQPGPAQRLMQDAWGLTGQ